MYLFYGEMLKLALKKYIFAWYKSQTCNTWMYVNFKKSTYMQVLHLCMFTGEKGQNTLRRIGNGENV